MICATTPLKRVEHKKTPQYILNIVARETFPKNTKYCLKAANRF